MNEFIYIYLTPKKVEVELPDGGLQVTTAKFKGLSTPDGQPVIPRFIGDTLQPWKGSTRYYLDGQQYDGAIVATFGPETVTEVIPQRQPYDPSNGNPGGH